MPSVKMNFWAERSILGSPIRQYEGLMSFDSSNESITVLDEQFFLHIAALPGVELEVSFNLV